MSSAAARHWSLDLDGDRIAWLTLDRADAAANSLSDVYAMGGTPITALNIAGFPMKEAPHEWLHEILRGGAEKALEAGVAILGGHTVEDPEIKYGLSVTGIGSRHQVTANRGARVGDRLVLTKALGTGLVTSAIKRGVADEAATRAVLQVLNHYLDPDQIANVRDALSKPVRRLWPEAAADLEVQAERPEQTLERTEP